MIFRLILVLVDITERTFRSGGELVSATLSEAMSRLGRGKVADRRRHVYSTVQTRDCFAPVNDALKELAIT